MKVERQYPNTSPPAKDDCQISPEFWAEFRNASCRVTEDWSGDFAASIYSPVSREKSVVRVYGVSFSKRHLALIYDPEESNVDRASGLTTVEKLSAFARLLAQEQPSPRAAKDYVSEAQVVAWHKSLSPQDQARGFRWLWRAARDAHSPRQVYKKHVLRFVEGRPKGRPRNGD